MANLSFIQKQLIENVFGMGSGYFLDFNNREFEEYMKDVVNYSVSEKYPGVSKAKKFRAFCGDEDDRFVGKAIIIAINYMKEKGLDNGKENDVEKLYELGKRLLGKEETIMRSKTKSVIKKEKSEPNIDYDEIINKLFEIEKEKTTQLKGYALEKFITWLFSIFELEPRASYKTDKDQIDGSFLLGDSTIILEAKHRSKIIDKTDLVLFQDKVSHKSIQTKGLFLSYSEVSDTAIDYFLNHSSRITIMYTSEIFQMCWHKADLKKILRAKFRHLDETGCIWCPITDYEKMK